MSETNSKPETGANENRKPPAGLPSETRRILDQLHAFRTLPLDVWVELGAGKLTLRDLLGLRHHSVVALDQNAGAKLNVYVNGVLAGRGEPTVLENRLGIKIDEILDSQL